MEGTPIPPPTPGPDPLAARRLVQAPAILLIVLGALALIGGLGALLGLTGGLLRGLANAPEFPAEARDALLQATGRSWLGVPNLVIGVLMLLGGLKMKELRSYGLALTGSIVALIPCLGINGCCCIAIPVGVWSLVVLMKPEVKGAFRP